MPEADETDPFMFAADQVTRSGTNAAYRQRVAFTLGLLAYIVLTALVVVWILP